MRCHVSALLNRVSQTETNICFLKPVNSSTTDVFSASISIWLNKRHRMKQNSLWLANRVFSFLQSMVGSRRIFFFRKFNFFLFCSLIFFCKLVLCKQMANFFHSLSKQMIAPDKVFMIVRSTTFVHTHVIIKTK